MPDSLTGRLQADGEEEPAGGNTGAQQQELCGFIIRMARPEMGWDRQSGIVPQGIVTHPQAHS